MPVGEPPKADPKEVKALKEDLAKVKAAMKEKDEQCEYPVFHSALLMIVKSLEREYKAEVQHSQNLQASRSGAAPAVAPVVSGGSSEEAAQDAACIRLYEDLCDLSIPSVKIRDTGKSGNEITYNCIQSHAGRSGFA